MAFNGRAVRLGTTTNFNAGGVGAFPRAIASVDDKLLVVLAGAYTEITDIPNGSGSAAVSFTGASVQSNQIGGAFEWNSELWFTLRGGNDRLVRCTNLTTGACTSVRDFTNIELGACTTDGTTIWAFASNTNTLYTLRTSTPNIYTPETVATIQYEDGVTEGGIQGMFIWDGVHYLVGGHNDMLYRLSDVSSTPITATRVDPNVTQFGIGARGPAGACEHNGEVYMVDGAIDALTRLINPPVVQANIPRFAFDEGTEQTLDMTQYIDDLDSIAFRSGYTEPAYASIGDDDTSIDFADTSDVTQDTDLTLQLSASRGMDAVNVDMPIRVQNVGTMQPDLTPDFGSETITDIVATRGTAITTVTLPAATGGDGTLTYSLSPNLPTGLSFDASTRQLSGTPTALLSQTAFTYTVTDADGDTDTLTFDITVNAPDLMPAFADDASIDDIVAVRDTAITAVTLPAATGGDGTLTYSLSPNLPTGLSFNASTRQLSGTPTALLSQTEFTYTVTDADGDTDTLTFDITVNAPVPVDLMPSFGGATIADIVATQNTAITAVTLPAATGGDGTLTYSLSPALPTGFSFNAATRRLSGTPTALLRETEYTYTATDADGDSVSLRFRLTVNAPARTLSIESIDEQFIAIGTKDYALIIDIGGNPDTVDATGHMEGFDSHWDAARGQLHIRAAEVTRLISGVHWDVDARKGMERLLSEIGYNVIKAPPIFETLPMLHLYRGVPINFDIVIQNIPNLIIPDARLLGIKSELLAYGLNFGGRIPVDSVFSFNTGNITLIIPSDTGETADMHDYPYIIESGSPPAIDTPTFTPKGNFGELVFSDVNHALGYEWQIEGQDDWHLFSDSRPPINPDAVEVTPGNLQVTLKFPNVAGASSYEYSLDSETHEREWTPFTGTLENNMITTIIPDLEDGVEYTLRLRVASPWIGAPISLTVYGGRVCYTIQWNTSDRTQQYLYIFHTGHQHGTRAPRIKRLLLPTALSHPESGGLAVNASGDVFILHWNRLAGEEKSLYTFLASTIANAADGSRLTQDRKNVFPSIIINDTNSFSSGMAEHEGNLYIYLQALPTGWNGVQIFPVPTTDGAEMTRTTTEDARFSSFASNGSGLSVTDEAVWYPFRATTRDLPAPVDIDDFSVSGERVTLYASNNRNLDSLGHGLKVIGDVFYTVVRSSSPNTRRLEVFRINPEVSATNYILDFYLELPIGLTDPRYLDILE